ncbi:hypothetical protein E1J38_013320 [Seonamhaeicola sediminis]|uniref:DNA phosphorothioation-associated protein 4 n=1 Tax=Seonamhaeicola sediminis TaxID=2528206 RepID=A0A562YBL8_9FLAO|nr:hypothetical protein [Seonamhaeicola sediminis]TWO31499.1 hypothetical protein E1J38_013320 [Seonamhaeicola sediminis]
MTAQEFKSNITTKRPRYADSRIPLLEAFSEKGSRNADYSRFGPIYELYIYAMMLGIKRKTRLPLPPRNLTSDFLELGKWKRDSSLVDFLLMIIFTQTEDLSFDWNELEDMEEEQLNKVVSEVITLIEEYANGGLEYLETLWQKGELDTSHYMFIDLYKNLN